MITKNHFSIFLSLPTRIVFRLSFTLILRSVMSTVVKQELPFFLIAPAASLCRNMVKFIKKPIARINIKIKPTVAMMPARAGDGV